MKVLAIVLFSILFMNTSESMETKCSAEKSSIESLEQSIQSLKSTRGYFSKLRKINTTSQIALVASLAHTLVSTALPAPTLSVAAPFGKDLVANATSATLSALADGYILFIHNLRNLAISYALSVPFIGHHSYQIKKLQEAEILEHLAFLGVDTGEYISADELIKLNDCAMTLNQIELRRNFIQQISQINVGNPYLGYGFMREEKKMDLIIILAEEILNLSK